MSKFVLTAQLQLQAPTNTRQVVADLRKQLAGGLNVPVTVSGAAKAQKQINDVTKSTKQAASAAQNMGRTFGLAFKRFAAFTVASRAVSLFTNTLANAVDEALDFQQEMVKISQVTGKAMKDLKGLERTIFNLATTLGVSSKELLSTTRILSQAGIKARDLDTALAALAKTTLAPTFEDINKTAEGAIAILAQFGQGVGALESQLGSINAVAGQFAVESGDLIGAIRRTGGVFKEAGGTLEEFLGLFTSIRATTRESSESIATGLRTIFTRLQRPRTLEFLRQYGVELQDLEGRFVGPNEAVKRLNAAIGGLDQGDITFIKIAEEIAGFRQIGKVIPLIKEYELAEKARQVAVAGGNSLAEDAATAQQSLARQILKVKQEFQELIQSIANTTSFQAFVKTSLNLASALIKVADAIKPLIPLIAGLAAFKFARGLGGFASGLGGALRGASGKNQGGKILAFARGGMVPGQGNRDTVPAMLQPGEFVIRKSSVNKMGAGTLAAMNNNRFAQGGIALKLSNPEEFGAFSILDEGLIAGGSGRKISEAARNNEGFQKRLGKLMAGLTPGQVKGKQIGAGGLTGLIKANGKLKENQGDVKAATAAINSGQFSNPQLSHAYGADAVNSARLQGAEDPRGAAAAQKAMNKRISDAQALYKSGDYNVSLKGPFKARQIGGPRKSIKRKFAKEIREGAHTALKTGVEQVANSELASSLDLTPIDGDESKLFSYNKFFEGAQESVEGYLLEGVVGALTNAKVGGGGTNFDFPEFSKASKGRLKKLFANDDNFIDDLKAADAKRQLSTALTGDGALVNKIIKDSRAKIQLANKGGGIGGSGDTVPALLTPGEFVINKSAAKSIGYNNLSSMNKSGVSKFNKGGAVGVQRFAEGGGVAGSVVGLAAFALLNTQIQELGTSADGTRNAFGRVTDVLMKYGVAAVAAATAISQFTGKTISLEKAFVALKFAVLNPVQAFNKVKDTLSNVSKRASESIITGSKGGKFTEKTRKFITGKDGKEEEVFGRKIRGKSEKTGKMIDKTVYSPMDMSGPMGKINKKRTFQASQITRKEGSGSFGLTMAGKKGAQAQKGAGAFGGDLGASNFDRQLTNLSNKIANVDIGKIFNNIGSVVKNSTPAWLANTVMVMKNTAMQGKQMLMNTRFGKSLNNFGKGLTGKAGATRSRTLGGRLGGKVRGLGQGIGNVGKGVGRKVGGLAKRLPFGSTVARGVSGLASTAGAASTAAGGGLAGVAAGAAAIAGPVLAVVAGLKLLSDVAGALVNVEGRKKDAIKAGNEAEAGRLAAMQNFDGLLGGLSQGLVATASAAAGMVGSLIDLIPGVDGVSEGLQFGVTRITEILTGDFSGSLRKFAVAQAAAAKTALEYADTARKASRTMEDIKSGRVSARQGFDDVSAAMRKQGADLKKAQIAEESVGGKSNGLNALFRNIGAVATNAITFGGGMEFAGTRNERIDETKSFSKEQVDKFQKEFDKLRPGFQALGKELVLSGKGLDEYKQILEDNGTTAMMTDEQMKALEEDFTRQQEAIEKNIAFIEAMNFGLREITAAANAAAISMDNVAAAGQAGFNSFSASASVLEASVTAAGKNISDADMDAALVDLESSMRKFGANDKQVAEATGTVGGLRTAQANAGAALDAAKDQLISGQDVSPKAIKDALGDELLKGVEGPAKEKLKTAIENMQIDQEMREAIKAGNLDKVLEKTLDPVAQAASEQALALLKKRAEVENKLISAIKNRQRQEQEYITAQKQAIDIQLEASKAFEKFGGAAVTTQQKLGARISQANLSLGAAGVGGLASGGAGDIRRALSDVRSLSATQNAQANTSVLGRARGEGTAGAFEGAEGLDADKRDEAKSAQKALVNFTKQRISLIQEELKIAEQKNKAEKDALDKLLGGDVEGFLEQQIAAAAGSALKTGDAGLAGAFGAGALGAGFKTLEGQGLSDSAMERAASLSLSSVGVSDPRAAEVMAGTTAEMENLKSEGRELAQVLGEAGQLSADLEQMDVNAATVVVKASRIAMDQFQNQPPQGLARGGVVYANRGMFVPRGTDTVPAMLTPGEFVVNRSAVRAGNNLSVLKAMNGGGGAGAAMSRGGMVYMQNGGLMGKVAKFMTNYGTPAGLSKLVGGPDIGKMVENGINATSDGIKQNVLDPLKSVLEDPTGLKGAFTQFDQSVQKLIDFQLNVKVDPTNVTVNFQGSSFLAGLKDDIRNELLEKVKESIGQAKFNESGELEVRSGKV